jgi:hypothetical protein
MMTGCLILCLSVPPVFSEEPWRTEFDETCSKTSVAMTLTNGELRSLIEKCDRLQKVIETQEETVRKVFLKRLQMCKNLYTFTLDYKKQQK